MTELTQNEILRIFEELPNNRGYADEAIVAAEQQLGVELPPTYRHIMKVAGSRLVASSFFLSIDDIAKANEQARNLLRDEGSSFCLQLEHVIFAWDEIYAFFFFDGFGSDDVPVYALDYNSNPEGRPIECSSSVPAFIAGRIREELKL